MSDLTEKTELEKLNTQSLTEEKNNSESGEEYKEEHKEINGTPFHLSGNEEKGYFLRLGDFQMSPRFKTEAEVGGYINSNKWNIILGMIGTALTRWEGKKVEE